MNNWESIFRQSKVNDGLYVGDRLSTQNWDWPRQTWFQERLEYLRTSHAKQLNGTNHTALAPARDRQRRSRISDCSKILN
jgi:hypothetical protein